MITGLPPQEAGSMLSSGVACAICILVVCFLPGIVPDTFNAGATRV